MRETRTPHPSRSALARRQVAVGAVDHRALPADRVDSVVIEHRNAVDVIAANDGGDTLFYIDPPYLPSTRGERTGRLYRHEFSVDEHVDLLAFLKTLSGMVVLSGYPSALYDDALADWQRVETAALADGARPRTEVLWSNPAAAEALKAAHLPLFAA